MLRPFCIVLLTFMVSGCEIGPSGEIYWSFAEADAAKCQDNYGYSPKTPEYGACIQFLDVERRNRATTAQARGNALIGYGMQMMKMGQPRTIGGQVYSPQPSSGYLNSGSLNSGFQNFWIGGSSYGCMNTGGMVSCRRN